jgi:hypothetical protein
MKQKRTIIILAAIGIFFVLFWIVVIGLVVKTLRGSSTDEENVPVVEATLCDEDASGLCVVNFGANSLNRMVINFRLPGEESAAFYVKAKNRDTVSVYTCETDEEDLTSVHCTGVRTPLGETIDLEIYTTDDDKLIARGTFLVSAIAISTPISLTEPFIEAAPIAPSVVPTDVPTLDVPTFDFAATPTAEEIQPPSTNNEGPPDLNFTPFTPSP